MIAMAPLFVLLLCRWNEVLKNSLYKKSLTGNDLVRETESAQA